MTGTRHPRDRPEVVRKPRRDWLDLGLVEVWVYRDLLRALVRRNLAVRYKQSVLGVAWALLKPILQMVVFTVIFGRLAGMPSDDLPYPVFLFAGLLPWTYFASTLTSASGSLLAGGNMINKVYFPRMILPFSYLFTSLVDFMISLVVLLGMMVWYRDALSVGPQLLLCPLFMIPAVVFAAGLSLWLSALAVRFRDVHHLVPYLLQLGMFLTPVVYAVNLFPPWSRGWLHVNPMTGVVGGFRWALLGNPVDDWLGMGLGFLLAAGVFFSGVVFFRRVERTLADVI